MSIQIGDSATRSQTITDASVRTYADLVGDHNPVHLDDAYAAQTVFQKRIAHGMLVAGLISAAIAHDLPGAGSIYMGQSLKFKKPVYIGDTLTVTLTVSNYHPTRHIVTLVTQVRNQDGVLVLDGEATVLAPGD